MFNGWCLHQAVTLQFMSGEMAPVRPPEGTNGGNNLKLYFFASVERADVFLQQAPSRAP